GKKDLDKKWSKYIENGIGIKFKRRNDDGGLISEEEMKQIFDIFIEYPAVSAYRNGKDFGLEKEEDKNKFIDKFNEAKKSIEMDIRLYQQKEMADFIRENEDAKRLYEEYQEYLENKTEHTAGDNERLISWVIISHYLKDISGENRKKLKDYIEDDEKRTRVEEKNIYQRKHGEDMLRPIFIKDLHYWSPGGKLLIANGDDYVSYMIGNGGDRSTGVSIGEYAGMAMKERLIFKDKVDRDTGEDRKSVV